MCKTHAGDIEKFPELVDKFNHVRQKITIMCLLDLIFQFVHLSTVFPSTLMTLSLPADERRIPLKVIGEQTNLDNDGVEFLLMRALSLHLIEGTIDQVDEFVQVSCNAKRIVAQMIDMICR